MPAADSCTAFAAPANGAASGTTGTTGTVRTFTCSAGFYLSGAASTTCVVGPVWSSPVPLCLRK